MEPSIVDYALFAVLGAAVAALGFALGRRGKRSSAVREMARERALEALGAGMVVLDGRGAVESCNAEARRLLGLGAAAEPSAAIDSMRRIAELSSLVDAGQGGAEYVVDEEGERRLIEARALPLGGDGGGTVVLMSDVTETATLLEELAALASTDALTGAFNRRHFDELGERDIDLARRSGRSVGVLMLDIDFFKRVNDGFGHAAGDRTLRAVSDCCREALRGTDVLARYGGEEFAVFLPGTGPEDSVVVAERLRRRVAELRISYDGRQISVTVSLGAFATVPDDGQDLSLYLRRADEALYRSKALGRDRVSYWQPLESA